MNIQDEPERPRIDGLSEEARVWIRGREDLTVEQMDELHNDMPGEVAQFISTFKRWRAEHQAWRKTLPVDYDPASNRWRMFGGPWIARRADVWVVRGGDPKWEIFLPSTLEHLVDSASEERLRALAAHVYEYFNTLDRAGDALVADFAKEWNER